MINPNQITAQLAKLPDSQLQQYAAMHKNDPYIMALAVSEASRRQQLRSAATPMPGQEPEPPKVADQAVADMVPGAGLDALPVGDMEFADGGIVGYNGATRSDVAEGSDIRRAFPNVDMVRRMRAEEEGNPLGATAYIPALLEDTFQGPIQGWKKLMSLVPEGGGMRPVFAATAKPAPVQAPAGTDLNDAAREAQKGAQYPAAKPTNKPAPKQGPQAGLAAAAKSKGVSASGAAAPASGLRADLIKNAEELRNLRPPEDKYDVQEEELRKKEASLAGKSDDNINMALIQAGLGMMASGSPYALQGIGEGAMKGVAAYLSGKKDITELEDKVSAAKVDMEKAKNAGNQKKYDASLARYEKYGTQLAHVYAADVSERNSIRQADAYTRAAAARSGPESAQAKLLNAVSAAISRDEQINAWQAQLKNAFDPREVSVLEDKIKQRQGLYYKQFGITGMDGAGATMPGPQQSGWGIRELQ